MRRSRLPSQSVRGREQAKQSSQGMPGAGRWICLPFETCAQPPSSRRKPALQRTERPSSRVMQRATVPDSRAEITILRVMHTPPSRSVRGREQAMRCERGMPPRGRAVGLPPPSARNVQRTKRPYAATAHPSDKTSACSNTVFVACSCLSGG